MKYVVVIISICIPVCLAAQNSKADKIVLESLKASVRYLADDKLEGRRTGSVGEKMAYEFIQKKFKKAGLKPAASHNGYIQPFDVNDGKMLSEQTSLTVNGTSLKLYDDWFPLNYSANTSVEIRMSKTGRFPMHASFTDLAPAFEANKDNPHFDINNYIQELVTTAGKGDTEALVFFNSSSKDDGLSFEPKSRIAASGIVVAYVQWAAYKKYFIEDDANNKLITIRVSTSEIRRTGHNVVGMLNNNAPLTIVFGAHYDHLGYGEDKNSLYAGKEKMIHNGADDNASGTAALIELAAWAKKSAPKNFNYIFAAFSGEELGLYGSKHFVENAPVDLAKINYMINMDMVGLLNDSTHGLTIGGYGTSPSWSDLLNTDSKYLKVKFDSSGSGPSDHTSFYRKDIPVLFFFTGTHHDYHKPTDDYEKINFNGELAVVKYIQDLVVRSSSKAKLAFAKTREPQMSKSAFKVTMGILIDYSFSGVGVLAEAVSDNRPAAKAGIQAGDIIVQLGEHKVTDVQSYMGALNKFNKGDSTRVKLLRKGNEVVVDLTF